MQVESFLRILLIRKTFLVTSARHQKNKQKKKKQKKKTNYKSPYMIYSTKSISVVFEILLNNLKESIFLEFWWQ